MFEYIKDSYLDENIFEPAAEQAMEMIHECGDCIKTEFDCKDCDNDKVCKLIDKIPNQIFDEDEFTVKIKHMIDSLPCED